MIESGSNADISTPIVAKLRESGFFAKFDQWCEFLKPTPEEAERRLRASLAYWENHDKDAKE